MSNFELLSKDLTLIVKKIQEFNANRKIIIDSFELILNHERIALFEESIEKEKGFKYIFDKKNLRISISENVLFLDK